MIRAGLRGLTASVLLLTTAAQAEVLTVEGVYPADSDGAAAMKTIAVESFGGSDGADLAIRIEDALRAVEIDGRPYFRVLPSASGGADGVLRGTATAEIKRERYTEHSQLEQATDSRCEDNSSEQRSPETVVRELTGRIAGRLRGALAPTWRRESIRVLEDRKGLSREDGEKFKNALRLTKTDAGAACRQWQAIADANPGHAVTLFNIGLCDEAAGNLDGAERLYREAAQTSRAGNVGDGLGRIAARRRASRQLAAHSAR
ncbi:MAG: hypothetical protein EOO76_18590 [Novosphingobium sp.]|nr:MAG: hypothetical protein EOO76_18590 [Novosphingobium sp.]